ncbi:ExbD/TolR family protein [Paraliomyxa miuraensis]|uniref:ExbD/TolR family protein n=1 Tax=Paraliomyxa miuraensis TaxID=376150 RepID=UPI002252CE9A|nr:biopolymer transporter ExbD [Paraliomyxa miuraensis]MCX4242479.1 biopolymer transporter ExbD [Paraliomyxa miuraensis]
MIEFESRRRETPVLNLSALIDIAFILVIFIVLGATFQRVRAVDVELPSADARSEPSGEALVISVPPEGPVRFGERLVELSDVRAALQEARAGHDSVVLLADRQADVQRAVQILADAQQVGFSTVSLATQPGLSSGSAAGGSAP